MSKDSVDLHTLGIRQDDGFEYGPCNGNVIIEIGLQLEYRDTELLSPRGQSGLEVKILASALVLASNI